MGNSIIERVSQLRHWVQMQQLAATQLLCLVMVFIMHRKNQQIKCVNLPSRELRFHRQRVREEVIDDLSNRAKCRDTIRMNKEAFLKLCRILVTDGGLRPTQRMSVEEQVARFLHIIGGDERNRFISWVYRRSSSTTSRTFHRVLDAILAIENHFLQQPTGQTVQQEIRRKKRFFPYFKDCVGAIDGTHVRVRVPSKDVPRYRGRKGYPTINVLVACTFNLKFTYLLSGWEGTASDSRIIKDALSREDKLFIPNGKHYLVDVGLPHKKGLIAPFRGVRYHLKEYSARGPQNPRELFNHRHASLRNTIERAFGVLKKRFPIIRSMTEPFYSCETQSHIFLACCILHNFLQVEDRDLVAEEEVIKELENEDPEAAFFAPRDRSEDGVIADEIRNIIANAMWTDYTLNQQENESDMEE